MESDFPAQSLSLTCKLKMEWLLSSPILGVKRNTTCSLYLLTHPSQSPACIAQYLLVHHSFLCVWPKAAHPSQFPVCLFSLSPRPGPAPRLRLADGPHGCAGRLEVWHSGRWGSVCDDAWDLRDAAVACHELGCGGALAAPGGAFFGEGAGPILLDDLRCRGNETALRFCPARPWGQHDCHHREDAGAVCDGEGALGKRPERGASSGGVRAGASRVFSGGVPQGPALPPSSSPPAACLAHRETSVSIGGPGVAGVGNCL